MMNLVDTFSEFKAGKNRPSDHGPCSGRCISHTYSQKIRYGRKLRRNCQSRPKATWNSGAYGRSYRQRVTDDRSQISISKPWPSTKTTRSAKNAEQLPPGGFRQTRHHGCPQTLISRIVELEKTSLPPLQRTRRGHHRWRSPPNPQAQAAHPRRRYGQRTGAART